MKKVVFVSVLFVTALTAFSQSGGTPSEKRMRYGFNLGVNYSNLLADDALPGNATLSNNLGFRLGLLADYQISKSVSISPKAELSFNNSKVNFTYEDGSQPVYKVLPVSLDFMTHFIFKKNNEQLSPYFFIGPNVKVPVSKRTDDSTTFSTNADFAIDFGIGLDKAFTNFHILPELRYSFGLLNINQHPSLQTLNFHNIALVFNFL